MLRGYFLLVILLYLHGCSITPPSPLQLPSPLRPAKPAQVANESSQPQSQQATAQTRFTEVDNQSQQRQMLDLKSGKAVLPSFTSQNKVSVNIDGLPLPAFINELYGNVLGLSFQIDTALQNKRDLVTLRITEPQMPADLYRLAGQVLDNYGVGILREGDLLRFVVSKQSGSDKALPLLVTGETLPSVPVSHRPVFQMVRMAVLSNVQMRGLLLKLFDKRQLKIEGDPILNAIVLSGKPELVKQAVAAIQFLDTPMMRGRYSLRIDPASLSATQLAQRLEQVLQVKGFAVTTKANALGSSVYLLPIEEISAVLVFAQSQTVLTQIKLWAAELDKPVDFGGKQGLFFYAVRNTRAETLADILQPLVNTGTLDKASPKQQANNERAVPQAVTTSTSLIVDNLHNALLFRGSSDEWQTLLPILQRLDKPAKMVLIEVTIADISLNEQEQFGIEWLLKGLNTGSGYSSDLSTLKGFPNQGSSGFNYTLLNGLGQTRVLLNAFASDRRINVLSSPRIMVKSGETASISVGDQIPIITSQSTDSNNTVDGTSTILQQIQYRNTGVDLSVKPVVHAGNKVDIQISQGVSDVRENTTSSIGSPVIRNRSINTTLTLNDGGSVLLGGLMRSSDNKGNSRVPVLGDLPLLGRLFRVDSLTTERTELIVVIVPYVIDGHEEAEAITQAFQQQLHINKPH